MSKITGFIVSKHKVWRNALTVVALLLAAAFAAAPAVAKPPPAGIWEQFQFKDAGGRTHTITQQVQIVRADYADTACNVDLQKHGAVEAAFMAKSHPEVANMSFVNADCVTDKSGQIKVAVGAWPGGQTSAAAPQQVATGGPAVIVMRFRARTGQPLKIVYGDRIRPVPTIQLPGNAAAESHKLPRRCSA